MAAAMVVLPATFTHQHNQAVFVEGNLISQSDNDDIAGFAGRTLQQMKPSQVGVRSPQKQTHRPYSLVEGIMCQ